MSNYTNEYIRDAAEELCNLRGIPMNPIDVKMWENTQQEIRAFLDIQQALKYADKEKIRRRQSELDD